MGKPAVDKEAALEFQAEIVAHAREAEPVVPAYASYQLIRTYWRRMPRVAAFACSTMTAARFARGMVCRDGGGDSAEMRVRCKVLTWQELASLLPEELQAFLDLKYGIVGPAGLRWTWRILRRLIKTA